MRGGGEWLTREVEPMHLAGLSGAQELRAAWTGCWRGYRRASLCAPWAVFYYVPRRPSPSRMGMELLLYASAQGPVAGGTLAAGEDCGRFGQRCQLTISAGENSESVESNEIILPDVQFLHERSEERLSETGGASVRVTPHEAGRPQMDRTRQGGPVDPRA